jgi:hypothetical protein
MNGLLGLIFISTNNKGLAPQSYVLFGVDFFDINPDVGKKLEKRVFKIRNANFFV